MSQKLSLTKPPEGRFLYRVDSASVAALEGDRCEFSPNGLWVKLQEGRTWHMITHVFIEDTLLKSSPSHKSSK